MITFESVNLPLVLAMILIALRYHTHAGISMSTPYHDSIEKYKNLMCMNDQPYTDNEYRDKRQTLQENYLNQGETLLIKCYLALLTTFGVFMNGYAIYKTTKVRRKINVQKSNELTY